MTHLEITRRLFNTQGKIIRIKRTAQKRYGRRRDQWPTATLSEYERLRQVARELQQAKEAAHG